MARKTSLNAEKASTKNETPAAKVEANKIEKELNPHHQNAKPKGRK